ncbi:hydantoinase/carbamoylase family amidase [Terracidiphilus gabretensis]|uniref:hydantoinase/carbamoylase family amidase n=1 Tax=Terracidiphilus gabretensis TaxID=1577687 RepID=UPI00071B2EFF|nr:hydantoinase/carbamoylase family amidase [Terracidiphilus gabretensis]
MAVNAELAIELLKDLRALTADEQGAQRVAWTPMWLKAREWFQIWLDKLPVKHHVDAAGNSWTTLKGESEETLILGSHLDSVPNGGWLDGALGVLGAYVVLKRISDEFDGRPPVTVRLVDWADEEGARFGRSLFGSSAFAGTQTIEADRNRTDANEVRLEDALAQCDVKMDAIGEAQRERENAAAYLELHIEQGPVLEKLGLPLGVVLGTKGVERHAITFHGQEAHSGSTPMTARRDALAAAAKLALEIRPIAMRHADAVCTMGSVKTFPGIVTAVVGRCETTLDQRDLDAGVLASMYAEAQAKSRQFATEEGCTVEWSRIWNIVPELFHPELIALAEDAVRETAGNAYKLPSGPLHDAAEVSRAGIPTVMLFVQSLNGISHNKIEDTREEHLKLAVEALDKLASKTMDWIQTRAEGR